MTISTTFVLDSAGLIALARLDLLELVATRMGPLVVAEAVIEETTAEHRPGAAAIRLALDAGILTIRQAAIDVELALGPGEAATIALAAATGAIAILDDHDARRVARRRDVRLAGTAAVIVRLKQLGAIGSVAPYLDQLERIGFRMADDVRAWALEAAGES